MRIFSAQLALELQMEMKVEPKMVRSHFRGELEIGKLRFQISMYKKIAEERLPPLKRHSLVSKFSKDLLDN